MLNLTNRFGRCSRCLFFYLTEEIINRFARDQPIELQEAIWKKCLYSISTKCKVLRAQKPTVGGIVYDDEYNEMKVSGDLDLLANVTCPESQHEIHRAILEQSGHLVAHEGQSADGMVAQGGNMVAQEGNMVAQEGDIVQQGDDMMDQEGDIVAQQAGIVTQDGDIVSQEAHIVTQDGHIVAQEGHIVAQGGEIVADTNHITQDEVAMEHEQEVTATIQIDQPSGLCEQHIQVRELVQQENEYV